MASPSPRLGFPPHPKLQSLLSQERVKPRTSNFGQNNKKGLSEQKPMKNFGEREARAYPGTAHFFLVPPIISGTGKATDFQFGQYIQRVHPNERPLKISGTVSSRGRSHGLLKNFRAPIRRTQRVSGMALFAARRFMVIGVE